MSLRTLSIDGGEARELLRLDAPESVGAIAWMANERELLVAKNGRRDEERTFELWGLEIDTAALRRFRIETKSGHVRSLSVHPNLEHVALILARGHSEEVWGLRLEPWLR